MRSFLEESLVEPCEECGWRRCGCRRPTTEQLMEEARRPIQARRERERAA